MNIFFDVDDTLIEPKTRILRPHAKEVIDKLRRQGHLVFMWSGRGKENASDAALWNNLEADGFFRKPEGLYAIHLREVGIYFRPDFCIDDHDEGLVRVYGGEIVKPYSDIDIKDSELLRVLKLIEESEAYGFKPIEKQTKEEEFEIDNEGADEEPDLDGKRKVRAREKKRADHGPSEEVPHFQVKPSGDNPDIPGT